MKFLNLFKANSEIDKLTSDLSKANADLATANSELIKLQSAAGDAPGKSDFEALTKANGELDAKLAEATADKDAALKAVATAARERDEAIAKISDFDAKVETK